MRFDDIEVKYNIGISDFLLSVLTVQPLVENAVKHGVSKTGHGGTVILSTEEQDNFIVITVVDDGVGFSKEDIDSSTHVGLYNVKKRLADMCGGTLDVESKKGVGTTVTVKIPKDVKHDENTRS